MNLFQRLSNLWKMSENPENDMLYYRDTKARTGKAEFITSDRTKEIMERKPDATLDDIISKS